MVILFLWSALSGHLRTRAEALGVVFVGVVGVGVVGVGVVLLYSHPSGNHRWYLL